LDKIPKELKTKQGYLKDGFVVDSSDTDEEDGDSFETIDDATALEKEDVNVVDEIEDIGSEMSEDSYDYSDEDSS